MLILCWFCIANVSPFSHLFNSWSMRSAFSSISKSWLYYLLKKGRAMFVRHSLFKRDCWSYTGLLRSMEFKHWWTFSVKELGHWDGMSLTGWVPETYSLTWGCPSLAGCKRREDGPGWLAFRSRFVDVSRHWFEQTNLIQFWLLLFTMTVKQSISS